MTPPNPNQNIVKIAIAQLDPTIGDLAGNAEKILTAAQTSHANGAELLLTPELSLCGYPPRDFLLNPAFIAAMAARLETLAAQLPPELAVLVGLATPNPEAGQRGQKKLFNSVALLQGGKIARLFHKRLLPTYDVFDEDRYFEAGSTSDSFLLRENLRVGVTICEDLWNDEKFWRDRNYEINPLDDLARENVDLVANLSASPYAAGKQDLREAMLAHSARRYQLPILYANQVGGNDDLLFDGSSVAFNRDGTVMSRAGAFETDLIYIERDSEKGDLLPTKIAEKNPCLEAEIWSALVMGVRDYATKCGFTKALLGLSGGIDSSLVAAIAADALGPENILCILMPSPYSSQGSVLDAEALIQNLGTNGMQIPIQPAMAAYDAMLEPLFAGTEFGVAEENIQSRARGSLLMAVANKFNYLLLSTGNKSEMAVGYCTLYGDMNGGLAVIADVPKTWVYRLCRWRNRDREIIPENVILKPPSAELKPDQKDSDSLPDYEILDDILERFIRQHQGSAEIIAAGHDPEIVARVLKLVARAEFKRRQAPPGLKISDRAFGTGWRMPIASRMTDF